MRFVDLFGTLIGWVVGTVVGLIVGLLLSGCASPVAQTGPWSDPLVTGKTGMPARRDKGLVQVGLCQAGPTRDYPIMAKQTCI